MSQKQGAPTQGYGVISS